MLEKIVYLEKRNYEPLGICSPEYFDDTIQVTDDGDTVNVNIPLCHEDKDCTSLNVIQYLLPQGKDPVDCLYCIPACDEVEEEEANPLVIPKAASADAPCISECIQKVRWWQDYEVHSSLDITGTSPKTVFKKVPQPKIIFETKIPRICGLYGLFLNFEVSPCFAEWVFKGQGLIPDDNSLQFIYGDTWHIEWPFSDNGTCFYPGELVTAYGYIRNTLGQCKPLPIAYGYFETRCFTSGLIQGCGLMDDNDQIVAGGHLKAWDDVYAGDDKLVWEVLFKGVLYWAKCSDFTKWSIGDRCIIHKSGIGKIEGDIPIDNHRCRNYDAQSPPVNPLPQDDEVLTDGAVAYKLDKGSDVIVPMSYFE